MAGLNYGTSTGELVIAGTSMHCPAWNATNLVDLWLPQEVRGSDRLIPGVAGVRPYKRRVAPAQHSIPMVVTGWVQPDGTPNVDGWEGLEENLTTLAEFVTESADPQGTWSATLTLPSGAVKTADIHVLALRTGELGIAATLAALEISIPAGVFA